jgi:hypothetical protein
MFRKNFASALETDDNLSVTDSVIELIINMNVVCFVTKLHAV